MGMEMFIELLCKLLIFLFGVMGVGIGFLALIIIGKIILMEDE